MNDMSPPLDSALLECLRATAFPGAQPIPSDIAANSSDEYWILMGTPDDPPNSMAWILPADPRHTEAYLRKWRPFRTDRRWKPLFDRYLSGRLEGQLGVYKVTRPASAGEPWTSLGWGGAIPPTPICYIGRRNRNQKLVAGLLQRETGLVHSVVKFPIGVNSRDQIVREARILKQLADEKPGVAPRPVLLDETRHISMEEAINGVQPPKMLDRVHIPFLLSLALRDEHTSLRAYVERQNRRVHEKGAGPRSVAAIFKRVFDLLDDPTELPAFWVHGDLNTGNMLIRPNGRLQACDWPVARRGGLPFMDIYAPRLSWPVFEADRDRIEIELDASALQAYAGAVGVDASVAPKVGAAYILSRLVRALRREQLEKAHVNAAQLANWLDDHGL